MKKTISLFLLSLISIAIFAQLEKKIKSEGVVEGSIIKDGKEIPGYIKQVYDVEYSGSTYSAPWNYQTEVRFIEKSVFETTEKIKNKMYESYGPKDIQGYKYESLVYVSLKFQDLTAVGMGLIPKMTFLRQFSVGKVSVYQYFSSPPAVLVGESIAPYYVDGNKPMYIYTKGDDIKTKGVNEMSIEKELADCPYVTEKQQRGEYKALGGEGEASGISKLMNNSLFRVEVRLQAINDYNNNCK